MRILVCGSRHFNDYKLLKETLDVYNISEIISGAARGADTLARLYGQDMGIPVLEFPALWDKYGRAAGPIRNREMLKQRPDLVVGFIHPDSRGTKDMLSISREAGIPVKEINIE